MAGGPFKMVDLKRSKESLGSKPGKITPSPYSYEHRITLDPDTLGKLGMDIPSVGDKFHVMGHGEVTSVSQHDSEEGGKSGRIELQLKKMALRKKSAGAMNSGMKDALNSGISEATSDE